MLIGGLNALVAFFLFDWVICGNSAARSLLHVAAVFSVTGLAALLVGVFF